MKRIKWLGVIGLVLCTMVMFSACGEAKNEATPSDKAEETTYKDTINVAINSNPPGLDAHTINSNIVGGISSHIYEPLFAMDKNYVPTAVLADSYTVSEDGLVYTIKLREGIKFHNDKELVADDVVASMSRWLESNGKAKNLIGGTTFEKVDDYIVKMTMPNAYSDVLTILSGATQFAAIYPKSSIDSATAQGITEYIGTGPYKLTEWKQDQYIHLSKYSDYKSGAGESSGFVGKKMAATENLYYQVVTDDATRIAGIQTAQYDVVEEIPLERYEELSGESGLKMFLKSGGTLNLFLNTTKGTLVNEKLRQAVLASLNNSDIMLASYSDTNLYSLNQSWINPDDSQWGSQAGAELYNQNNSEKAKKILSEAGYNNEKIVLVTTQDYSEMYNATLVVQEQLTQAGFNAEVESYDFATFMERRANPDTFDLFITSNRYNLTPVQLSVLAKDWAGLDRPEVTEGISAIRAAKTMEDASAQWDKLQLFLYEYGAATVIGHYSGVLCASTNVEDLNYFEFPVYWNVKVS